MVFVRIKQIKKEEFADINSADIDMPHAQTSQETKNKKECSNLLEVHLHYHKTPKKQSNRLDEYYSQDKKRYCVPAGSYYIYTKSSISWTAAFHMCKKQNQSLLSINSELEMRAVRNIIARHQHLSFSPVLFLNLKRNSNVSE